jgi:dTMP kinase
LAYQGYGRGFDLNELRAANRFATGGLKTDLTVLLDITPETSRGRLLFRQSQTSTAPDRIECEADDFHIRVRNGFLNLARRDPERFVVLSTDREQDEVAAEIRSSVTRLLRGCADAD